MCAKLAHVLLGDPELSSILSRPKRLMNLTRKDLGLQLSVGTQIQAYTCTIPCQLLLFSNFLPLQFLY